MRESPRRNSLRIWLIPLLAILLAGWAYHSVLSAGFIGLDDDVYVSENAIVRQGLSWQGIRWAFGAVHASTWQPLVWISYMADASLYGPGPAGFHATNLLIHFTNILLLFLFIRRLSPKPVVWAVTVLLFALHPIHVETVAWIAERKGLLSTSFAWISLFAYLGYARSGSRKAYVASLLALALGLMAKPMLLTLPLLFLLLDFWPNQRMPQPYRPSTIYPLLREKIPFFCLSIGSTLLTAYAQHAGGSFLDMQSIPLWGRLGNAVISIWRYTGRLIVPIRLALLYPHPGTWPIWLAAPASLALFGLAAYVWHLRRRAPWLLVGCAWFLISLFPVLGFAQFGWQAMANRFLYIPAVGLYFALGFAIEPIMQHHKRTGILIGTIVLVALAVRTQHQTRYWRDSLTLFTHTLSITQENWLMHNGIGAALSRAGRHEEAAEHFEAAIRLRPDRPHPWFNLGHVRFMQQRWDEAAAYFAQSIEIQPTYQARYNLAVTHTRRNDPKAAMHQYLRLLEDRPAHVPALLNLARLYREAGQWEQAEACYRLARTYHPGNLDARTGIALVMQERGNAVEALRMLMEILQEDPAHQDARDAVQRIMYPTQGAVPRPDSQ